jgi:hypothetical protein
MKLAIPFLLSIVVGACSSTAPRTWRPPHAEGAPAGAYEVSPPAPSPASTAPVAPSTAAQEHAHVEPTSSRLMLLFGMRFLDEDDYEPLEDQPTFGIDFSYEAPGSAIGFEVGLMGSYDDDEVLGADIEVSTGELYAGVRKTFGEPGAGFHPYVGGGVSLINVDIEVSGAGSDDDTSLAGYAHGGVLAQIGASFFVGADVRALFGSDIEIAGVSGDADYGQVALVLGWAF